MCSLNTHFSVFGTETGPINMDLSTNEADNVNNGTAKCLFRNEKV